MNDHAARLTSREPPTAAVTRVADIVAEALHVRGVRHAFGMPGGEVVTLVDALEQAGIRFVLTRQESGAAMAAAATSLTTGAPGLLVTTLGPGLANAVNGIADAVQERMPLLVISGVVDRPVRGTYTHQVLDHPALMRGAGVKGSFEITGDDAAAVVSRAVALSLTPPFGPVHIDLAPGVAVAPARRDSPSRPAAPRQVRLAADPTDPMLEEVRGLFERAERPLVVAGFDAARAGPRIADAMADLAARHQVPVITTYKAKGLVDETEPFALGAAGLSPKADSVLLPLAQSADLVLLVGYDPIEMRPGWLDPFAAATVVELTRAPADHGMHRADLTLVGPLAGALDIIGDADPRRRWPGGEPARARARLRTLFEAPTPWGPHAAFDIMQRVLPEDALLTVDSGAHRILLSQRWTARAPLSVLQSAGWCTMGSALPLALGAALAEAGRRPVVAVVGDGGVEMTLGELGTFRDQGLPVIILVLQDASLALIELKQRQAGLAPAGVALGRTDLAAVAHAFGGSGATVRDAAGLEAALRAALARRDRFSLIACELEAAAYVERI